MSCHATFGEADGGRPRGGATRSSFRWSGAIEASRSLTGRLEETLR